MRLLALAALLLAQPALAGSLAIAPLRVNLAPEQRAATLTVHNTGAEEVLIQVEPMAWAQGSEELTPTRELLAVPAIARIAAGDKQLIRVALRAPFAQGTEAAYRLLVSEVPPDLPQGAAGVKIALRFSLPVFVTPQGAVPLPVWSWSEAGLDLLNRGSAHLQVSRIQLFSPGRAEPAAVIEQGADILPGQRHGWSLPPGLRPPLQLKADSDAGELAATLPSAAR